MKRVGRAEAWLGPKWTDRTVYRWEGHSGHGKGEKKTPTSGGPKGEDKSP